MRGCDWTSHPGETLSDILEERGIADLYFMDMVGWGGDFVTGILNGNPAMSISPRMAEQLERLNMGTTSFWLRREANYRADLAALRTDEKHTELRVHVLSADEAADAVNPRHDPVVPNGCDFTLKPSGIISINNTTDDSPPSRLVKSGFPILPLFFDDVCRTLDHTGYIAPTEEQVRAAIDWGRSQTGDLVVHCVAGISRSSAVALAILASRQRSTREGAKEAVLELFGSVNETHVMGLRPDTNIVPNTRIVLLADRILGFDLNLLREMERAFARRGIWADLGEDPPLGWEGKPA